MSKTIIIQASSRPFGDTHKVTQVLKAKYHYDIIDLYGKAVGHFDYKHENREDDFIEIMRHVIEEYNSIIFLTPVYWYSMSGILKVFFDRITDLLTIEKDLGRQLRGMSMGVISVSNDDDCIDSFDQVFAHSADYLGMEFKGHIHTWVQDDKLTHKSIQRIQSFID